MRLTISRVSKNKRQWGRFYFSQLLSCFGARNVMDFCFSRQRPNQRRIRYSICFFRMLRLTLFSSRTRWWIQSSNRIRIRLHQRINRMRRSMCRSRATSITRLCSFQIRRRTSQIRQPTNLIPRRRSRQIRRRSNQIRLRRSRQILHTRRSKPRHLIPRIRRHPAPYWYLTRHTCPTDNHSTLRSHGKTCGNTPPTYTVSKKTAEN